MSDESPGNFRRYGSLIEYVKNQYKTNWTLSKKYLLFTPNKRETLTFILRDSAIQSVKIFPVDTHNVVGQCESTMTSNNDPHMWCREHQVHFLLNTKQAYVLHHTHACLSNYVMIVTSGLIEIRSQGKVNNEWEISLVRYFFLNYT